MPNNTWKSRNFILAEASENRFMIKTNFKRR